MKTFWRDMSGSLACRKRPQSLPRASWCVTNGEWATDHEGDIPRRPRPAFFAAKLNDLPLPSGSVMMPTNNSRHLLLVRKRRLKNTGQVCASSTIMDTEINNPMAEKSRRGRPAHVRDPLKTGRTSFRARTDHFRPTPTSGHSQHPRERLKRAQQRTPPRKIEGAPVREPEPWDPQSSNVV